MAGAQREMRDLLLLELGWRAGEQDDLRNWLRDSAAVLVDRWRATYAAAGGR
jgi:hypothetical protein